MNDIRDRLEASLRDPLTFEAYRASIRGLKRHPSAADEELWGIEDALLQLEERLEDMLARHPLAVNLHELSYAFWRFRGDGVRADVHLRILRALAESIGVSGDGNSAETALIVDSVAEELLYVRESGLERKEQSLIESAGRWYDVFHCRDAERKEVTLWFDINSFYPQNYGAS
jgi:hypothetical protein